MTDNKKKWVKPELIILVRSNPAEAVLHACKTPGPYVGAPAGEKNACMVECIGCMQVTPS